MQNPKPPRWIISQRDLPQGIAPKKFVIRGDQITLSGRRRQTVEALQEGPIFCASTVRLSDIVFRLKSESGVDVATETTADGRKFYRLQASISGVR